MKCIQSVLQALLVLSLSGWISCADNPEAFALDLYKKIAFKNPGKNMIFSPLCVWEAFGMVEHGAKGDTKAQLKKVLGLSSFGSEDAINEEFRKNLAILTKKGNKYTAHLANRLFLSKEVSIREDFLADSKKYFGSTLENLDFKKRPEKSRGHINDWVSNQTSGTIKNFFPQVSIDRSIQLAIANAIYFKAEWKFQFDPRHTIPGHFRISKSQHVNMDLMHLPTTPLNYYDSPVLKCQILELPYQGDRVSMFIALPHGHDLAKVEKALVSKKLSDEMVKVSKHEVKVTLPKFKIEATVQLKQRLLRLGVRDLFDPTKSDLSGISDFDRLHFDHAHHKAFINVTEFGTEATGATAASGTRQPPSSRIYFKADRPFLFMIKTKDASIPLFCGRFVRLPRKK